MLSQAAPMKRFLTLQGLPFSPSDLRTICAEHNASDCTPMVFGELPLYPQSDTTFEGVRFSLRQERLDPITLRAVDSSGRMSEILLPFRKNAIPKTGSGVRILREPNHFLIAIDRSLITYDRNKGGFCAGVEWPAGFQGYLVKLSDGTLHAYVPGELSHRLDLGRLCTEVSSGQMTWIERGEALVRQALRHWGR